MADTQTPTSEVPMLSPESETETPSSGLFDRVKQAVGLSPKGHKIEFEEHELHPSPRSKMETGPETPTTEKPLHPATGKTSSPAAAEPTVPSSTMGSSESQQPAYESRGTEVPLRVQAEKLLKPQEVEVGMEKPQLSAPEELPPLTGSAAGAGEGATASTRTAMAPATPSQPPRDLAAGVISDLEARGFHHGRISREGEEKTTTTTTTTAREKEITTRSPGEEQGERRTPSPTQGERVKASRYTGSTQIPSTMGAMVQKSEEFHPLPTRAGHLAKSAPVEVYARRRDEVGVLSGSQVAEMKASEHAAVVEEQERKVNLKQKELMELRHQAEALEKQSEALLQSAAKERQRLEVGQRKLEQIEHAEWKGYVTAERAEEQRRAVVERAKPAARAAETHEREAVLLKQQAAESEFHAQVLENRARALIRESEEMADLSLDKMLEAERVAAELGIARQEIQELKQQIDTHPAGSLPQYINECQKEMGELQHRIMQLREEISWAEEEIERGREEADAWRRIVVSREGKAARLLLELTQLQEDAKEARLRSRVAAEEALQPAELAEKKYEEAWAAGRRAEEEEAEAKAAQESALEVVKEAVQPEHERQSALRGAAEAELAAKTVDMRMGVIHGTVQTRLHVAEMKADTAVHLAEKAQETEKEIEVSKEIIEAESGMKDMYREEQRAHPHMEIPAF